MGSIGRYIFRTTLGAFLVVLVSVTTLIWITQAFRDIDLMTHEGQSVLTFIGLTMLIIPLLVMIIAPIAFMVAMIASYGSPRALRELSHRLNDIRADLIGSIVQPGRFVPVSHLTLHIRERLPSGQLLGIMIDDQRNPTERVTFLAERGDILTHDRTYLLLADGSVQRQKAGEHDPNIVEFDRYAFDLSQL